LDQAIELVAAQAIQDGFDFGTFLKNGPMLSSPSSSSASSGTGKTKDKSKGKESETLNRRLGKISEQVSKIEDLAGKMRETNQKHSKNVADVKGALASKIAIESGNVTSVSSTPSSSTTKDKNAGKK